MDLWPKAQQESYAVCDAVVRPGLSVSVASLRSGCNTPLHTHPGHDQMVYVVEGSPTLDLDDGRNIKMPEGSTVIIPAGKSHGFSNQEEDARILTVLMGEGAEKPGTTSLPKRVKAIMQSGLAYAMIAPREVATAYGFTNNEAESLMMAINKARTNNKRSSLSSIGARGGAQQKILGWIQGNTFYLSSSNIRIALALTKGNGAQFATMMEKITCRDIDFTRPAKSAQMIPVLK